MLSLADVNKLLKSKFIESIVANKLRIFAVFSGHVAELKRCNNLNMTQENGQLSEVALSISDKDLPLVDKIKVISRLKKKQLDSDSNNSEEYMVSRYLKIGSEHELKFIEIQKSLLLSEMMLSELGTVYCYVDTCLSILGNTDINRVGYILYAEELMAHTGSALINKKGDLFPVLLSDFIHHYELKPLELKLTQASVFFLKEEVDFVLEEIKEQRKLKLKEERNKTIEAINKKRIPKKRKGIEFAIDLWSKDQSLSKNEVASKVNQYLNSIGFDKISKNKTIASTWLTERNIPNLPDHASKVGMKKQLIKI